MGLNIGIHVFEQTEGYGEYGANPRGTIDEIEQSFFRFLNHRFPLGGFGSGWVHLGKNYEGKMRYDFDVRMFSYGTDFETNGYKMSEMWLAIAEYIFDEFSHMEGIKLETYWSG